MISVGIIGGSGYLGKKLIYYCDNHPFVQAYEVYGNSSSGENLWSLFPEFYNIVDNKKIKSITDLSYEHDLYFVSLPHGESLKIVPVLESTGKKIIDLSGDYRLDSSYDYEGWYGLKHTSPELLNKKIYGLADVNENDLYKKNLIANPGCYPTAALLSILPLLTIYCDEIVSVIVNSYSGSSGAGKSPKVDLLLAELDGNVNAYNIHKHRHEPEILQELKKNGFNSHFVFNTHLLPIAVGIYSTVTIHLSKELKQQEIEIIYNNFFEKAVFVRMRNIPPQLKWVVGTNYCDINISVRKNSVVITAAIDNLIKGGAGQAIQNMNKLYALDETTGISSNGVKNVQIY